MATNGLTTINPLIIEIEPGFEAFVPPEFRNDPLRYFEERGRNIRRGEVKYKPTGEIKKDPTAIKELPVWVDDHARELIVVAKRINVQKAEVAQSNDPFHEYRVMLIAREFGLPCPQPVARIVELGTYLFVMERVAGLRLVGRDLGVIHWLRQDEALLKDKGREFSAEEFDRLMLEASRMMSGLQSRYESVGLIRSWWRLKDMILDVDLDRRVLRSITPIDWEKTRIDAEKLAKARSLTT